MEDQEVVRLGVKVGDRVRYINECDTEDMKRWGWYPPTGTWGTVTKVDEERPIVEVQWDSGTAPGAWWVNETEIALLTYKEDDPKHKTKSSEKQTQTAKRGNSSQK